MRLNISFSFKDEITDEDIFEWRKVLSKSKSCNLTRFVSRWTVLDSIIEEKAYIGLADGFYSLPISGNYNLGLSLAKVGKGSYVICVYEPILSSSSGYDFKFRYHYLYTGGREEFERLVSWGEVPYFTGFNRLSRYGVNPETSLEFLREESKDKGVREYLDSLIDLGLEKIEIGNEEELVAIGKTRLNTFYHGEGLNRIVGFNRGLRGVAGSDISKEVLERVADSLNCIEIIDFNFLSNGMTNFIKSKPLELSSSYFKSIEVVREGNVATITFLVDSSLEPRKQAKRFESFITSFFRGWEGELFISKGEKQVITVALTEGEEYIGSVLYVARLAYFLKGIDEEVIDVVEEELNIPVKGVKEEEVNELLTEILELISKFKQSFGYNPPAIVLASLIHTRFPDIINYFSLPLTSVEDTYLVATELGVEWDSLLSLAEYLGDLHNEFKRLVSSGK